MFWGNKFCGVIGQQKKKPLGKLTKYTVLSRRLYCSWAFVLLLTVFSCWYSAGVCTVTYCFLLSVLSRLLYCYLLFSLVGTQQAFVLWLTVFSCRYSAGVCTVREQRTVWRRRGWYGPWWQSSPSTVCSLPPSSLCPSGTRWLPGTKTAC